MLTVVSCHPNTISVLPDTETYFNLWQQMYIPLYSKNKKQRQTQSVPDVIPATLSLFKLNDSRLAKAVIVTSKRF